MQEIEVGEYVRTTKGYIAKVIEYKDELICDKTIDKCDGEEFKYFFREDVEENIVKHSKNIIDLIEDGDYLNGYLVRKINGELCNFDLNTMEWTLLKNIDIFESLVTKQQFESIEYKI